MKKVFVFSVLAIMAVVSSNAWAGRYQYLENEKTVFGDGSQGNFNIATVDLVQRMTVPSRGHSPNNVAITDPWGEVQFVSAIDQERVSGLTTALDGKVDDTQIADADATVADANMDTMVPTVQRMANAIAAAVESGVGSVDMSSKVDKTQVIKANGTTTLAGTTVDAATLDKDTVAPTIANVEENFAPRVAEVAYNNGENTYIEKPSDLPYGSYALVVDVYEDTTTYRWVAMSTGSSGQVGCRTTAGDTCTE
ncbi:MAG: hypothetical protein IKB49_04365 [Alphaproteobacteria bacterium]|nr:hypothetical protein [Alphaproteobacteria bacterium]